jgi:hypothetical protein
MRVMIMENESKRLRGMGRQRGNAVDEVPAVGCMVAFDP